MEVPALVANRVECERDREALASLQNIWNHNYDPSADPGLPAPSAQNGLSSSGGTGGCSLKR